MADTHGAFRHNSTVHNRQPTLADSTSDFDLVGCRMHALRPAIVGTHSTALPKYLNTRSVFHQS
jgi:hypothetical protein